MSIDVTQFTQTPYRQTPVGVGVSQFNPPSQAPRAVTLTFNWAVYFAALNSAPNIAVNVDVNQGGTSQGPVIDKIVTVKVDNSNSFNTILIYFPDTGDTVSCAPQTIVTLPCVTNGSNCKVIAQGLATGFLPLTTVTFYNYFVPPSVDPVVQLVYPQWIGSPNIQRNASQILTAGYASPALGDQNASANVQVAAVGNTGTFGALFVPQASGFWYITYIHWSITFITSQPTSNNGNVVFESTGATGTVMSRTFSSITGVNENDTVLESFACQIKLPATETYRTRVTAALNAASQANVRCRLIFSFNER